MSNHFDEIADFLLGWFGFDILHDDVHPAPSPKQAEAK